MICSVKGCQSKIYARGWCRKHYRHVTEGGHTEPLPITQTNCPCGNVGPAKANSSGLCRDCYRSKWDLDNKIKQKLYKSEYNIKNKEKISEQCKEWHAKNKHKTRVYYAEKRKDAIYRLSHNLRSRLYDFLIGKIKHKSTKSLVGCSFEELKSYLQSKFEPGMTWDNYGSYWCVDHIEPYSSISRDDKIGIERISHYTNLRPLKVEDNCRKAAQDKLWKIK